MPDASAIKEQVKDALKQALKKEQIALKVREGLGERLDLVGSAKSVAADTLTRVIEQQTKRELCNHGLLPNITCKQEQDRLVWVVRVNGRSFVVGLRYGF
jgi:hypothetical protein